MVRLMMVQNGVYASFSSNHTPILVVVYDITSCKVFSDIRACMQRFLINCNHSVDFFKMQLCSSCSNCKWIQSSLDLRLNQSAAMERLIINFSSETAKARDCFSLQYNAQTFLIYGQKADPKTVFDFLKAWPWHCLYTPGCYRTRVSRPVICVSRLCCRIKISPIFRSRDLFLLL